MADDPFVFMIEDCQIPLSQEEILRDCPFLGQPVNTPGDGVTSNLPEIAQDAGEDRVYRDVFITPPQEQPYFRPCLCHKAVQTDDESVTQCFDYFTRYADGAVCVDLGDDSESRFSLPELNLMTDTMVAGCSFWNDGARVINISSGEIGKFQVSCRDLSPNDSICEPPHKRMKASEQNLGFKSSQAQKIGDESDDLHNCTAKLVSNQRGPCKSASDPQPQQNIQIGSDKINDLVEISVENNLGPSENLESHCLQSETVRSIKECAETSEKEGSKELQKLRIISERLKDITEAKNEDDRVVSFVFDIFKSLTATEDSEKEDNLELESVSFLKIARSRNFTFPTPQWWMDTNT